MQKEFKQLDQQLQLNHLIRLTDPIPKPANSFFRALSISLFSTHNQTQFVKSIMKLTLLANCQAYETTLLKKKRKHHIAFPIISQSSQLVKKFVNDKQMLETYTQSPDLQCFQNDNYELAAFTFNRRVSVYYLNKDGYLNETLISCCRNKTGRKIHLCKVAKRYFAVEKQSIRSMTSYVREYLLGNMISQIVLEKSDKQNTKVHFSALDQILISPHKKYPKIHKKSLSECGDIINKLQQFRNGYAQQMQKNFHINIKNNSYDQIENRSHQEQPKDLIERDLDDFCDKDNAVIVTEDSSEVLKHQEKTQDKQQTHSSQTKNPQEVQVKSGKTQTIEQKAQTIEQKAQTIEQKAQTIEQSLLPKEQAESVAQTQQQAQQQQPSQLQYTYGMQQQQYSQQYASQLQAYYQNPYMYTNYQQQQQYDPQSYYANYYNLQQQMMYDPHYYSYYQQQPQTQPFPYSQPQQPYPYAQPQQTYPYSQPQQLLNSQRYTGRLKFFDTNGKYGFIIVDGIGTDLFVHYDDLSKAGMTKEHLETHSASKQLRFSFTYCQYEGKNRKAKKAIDLLLLTQL